MCKQKNVKNKEQTQRLGQFLISYRRNLRPGTEVRLTAGLDTKKTYKIKKVTKSGKVLLEDYYGLNSAKETYDIKVHQSNVVRVKKQ